MPPKRDVHLQTGETAEFPITCSKCLGDNPYIRMTCESMGKQCKICDRPFTVFRWSGGDTGRYRRTEICQVCTREKNICQSCGLDLEFGLAPHIRDRALKMTESLPQNLINRQYHIQNLEAKLAGDESAQTDGGAEFFAERRAIKSDVVDHLTGKALALLEQADPVEGKVSEDVLSSLKTFDPRMRFQGLGGSTGRPTVGAEPPADPTFKRLFVSNVSDSVSNQAIIDALAPVTQVQRVVVSREKRCAFVECATRAGAEKAVGSFFRSGLTTASGERLRVSWARSAGGRPVAGNREHGSGAPPGSEANFDTVFRLAPPPGQQNGKRSALHLASTQADRHGSTLGGPQSTGKSTEGEPVLSGQTTVPGGRGTKRQRN